MNDLISVVVPVYNCEKYLNKCVASLFAQTHQNLEIILVDDGSTDSSPTLCDSFAEKDGRVKVLHIKNNGVAVARNKGLEIANGDYITFLDSDDWVEYDMYEYLLSLVKSGDYQISACDYQLSYDDAPGGFDNSKETLAVLDADDMIKNIFDMQLWSLCTKLYSKHLFDGVSLDNSGLTVSEDLVLNCELMLGAEKMIVSNLKKYYYYRHKGSAMASSLTPEFINDSFAAYKMISEHMQSGSAAQSYFYAHRVKNDFVLTYKIIRENACFECYDMLKNDIVSLKNYIFAPENSFAFKAKNKIAYYLLRFFPHIYKLFVKLK